MKLYSFNKLIFAFLVFVICMSVNTSLNATHIVGGDLTYKCLGGEMYEITLTLRRDCIYGSDEAVFDDPAVIGIFQTSNGNFLKQLGGIYGDYGGQGSGVFDLVFNASDTLNETITSECGFVGEQVCVEKTIYKRVVHLPYLANGITLAYQRCCRNETLTNVNFGEDVGSVYYVEISKEAQEECNNSPVFNDWADIYICKDSPIMFDHSATDFDGDSLVYSLCLPNTALDNDRPILNFSASHPEPELIGGSGPGTEFDYIDYATGYSVSDMMGGIPLSIDSKTGLLTGTPNMVGQYLIGVCVEEYRDGEFIGRTKRDFQYNVRICSEAPQVDFTYVEADCGSYEINFTSITDGVDQFQWYFNYPSTSPDSSSNEKHPTFIYTEPGVYVVALIGERNSDGCGIFVTDTLTIGNEGIVPLFSGRVSECTEDGMIFNLIDTSISTEPYPREWIVMQGGDVYNSTEEEWTIILLNEESVKVQLIVGEGACIDTLTKIYSIEQLRPTVTANFTVLDCVGDSVIVKINADFTVPDTAVHLLSNHWEINTGVGNDLILYDDVNMATVTIGNMDSINLVITAISDNGCDIEYETNYIHDKVEINFIDSVYVLCEGDSIKVVVDPNSNWDYVWDPMDGLIFESDTDFSDPWVKPNVTTTYNVTVTDGVCSDTGSIKIIVLESLDVSIAGDRFVCDDDVKLWVEGSVVGTMDFEWSLDPDFDEIIYVGDTLNTSLDGENMVTYYVRVVGGADCLSGDMSVKVTNDSFTVDVVEPNTVCVNDSFVAEIILTDLELTYVWNDSPYISGGNDKKDPTVYVIDGNDSFELIFVATNANGCTYTDTIDFVLEESEIMSFTSELECGTFKMCFTSTSDVDGANTNWDFGDPSTTADTDTGLEVCYTYPGPGTYTVTISDDSEICPGLTYSEDVIIPELLNLMVEDTLFEICEGETVIINASGNGTISYCDADGNELGTGSPFEIQPDESMVITVKLSDDQGCVVMETVTIVVFDVNMDLELEVDPDSDVIAGQEVMISLIGIEDGEVYIWDPTGETTPVIKVRPLETTTYTVTVTDENGCEQVLSTTVVIEEPPKCDEDFVFIPTAFSPNHDGENEVFQVYSNFLESLDMIIYNRWGEEIYSTTDINGGWDGTYKGAELSSDVYAFRIRAVCLDGQELLKVGNVTLLK